MASTQYLEQQTERREKRRPAPMIKARSKKRVKEQKVYVGIVKEKMATDSSCEIKAEGCLHTASGLHHLVKRSPSTFLNLDLLIRACDNCQGWVERFPKEAEKRGHSISKFKKL